MVKWTEKEINILRENCGKMRTKDLTRYLPGRSFSAIQLKSERMGLKSNLSRETRRVKFMDLKLPPNDKDMEGLWDALENFQKESRRLSTHQEDVTVEIDGEKPILFVALADLHIGAIGTRYAELRQTVDLLARTEDVYIGSVGDTVDNYLPEWHSEGQFGEIIPPEVQKKLVEYIFDKLNGKFLFLVQGCHDEASHEVDDFDWTKYLQSKLKCFNLGFGGFLNLKLGSQTYRIAARHKYIGNSSTNPTNTVKRLREQVGDFDIGIVAHNHQAAIERVAMPEKDRIFIRPGSFKRPDRFARGIGFSDTGYEMPGVILFPDKRRMIPFMNLEDGIETLKALKEKV